MSDTTEIMRASLEAARLALMAVEAASNGNEDEAWVYLREVQGRVKAADDAWQAAG